MKELYLIILSVLFCSCASNSIYSVPQQFKTIQGAIDSASYGDTIIVSPGVYHERIKLKAGITLVSAGNNTKGKIGYLRAEQTIIDGSRSDSKKPGVEMAEDSTIDGFTITGIGSFDQNLWIKHFKSKGEMQSHDHIGEPGIAGISANFDCVITNNIVHHIGYTGIALSGKNCSAKVLKNFSYRNMGGGIGSMSLSKAHIENNTCFENFYAGIGNDNASPHILNNICYGNIRAGIGISEGSSPKVEGNRCYNNQRAGIGIRTGSNTKPHVEKNLCFQNGMAGIGVKDDAQPTLINNKCYKNQLAGIGIRNNAQPRIIANECYENGRSGIGSMGSEKLFISKNFCHHNKASGIGFSSTKKGHAEVIENKLIDNGSVAVGIQPGWTVKMDKNLISRKGGMPPLIMVFNGSKLYLTQNEFNGGGVAALRLAGEAEVKNNRFIGHGPKAGGPPNFAIWALNNSKIKMIENTFSGWRHALHATSGQIVANDNIIRNFLRSAIVIRNVNNPTIVGNKAFSNDQNAQVLNSDSSKGRFER